MTNESGPQPAARARTNGELPDAVPQTITGHAGHTTPNRHQQCARAR
jgi:hypothetical protein